jgi:hypothetical protein
VQQPGVDADHEAARAIIRAASSSGCRSGTVAFGTAAAISQAARRSAALPHGRTTCSRAPQESCSSSIQFAPAIPFRPRRRVQQHDLASGCTAHQRRAIEPEIERTIRRVSEHLAGEHAVARDRMQRAIDVMVYVIEP